MNENPVNPKVPDYPQPTFFERVNQRMKTSVTIKLLTISFLVLLLLIPLNMVHDLIRERQYRSQDAIREVSQLWGSRQTVSGPMITVPVKYVTVKKVDDKEVKEVTIHHIHILPRNLEFEGEADPEKLHRGIFDVVVYRGKLGISGNFSFEDSTGWDVPLDQVLWDKAYLNLGITDLRSIKSEMILSLNGEDLRFKPGIRNNKYLTSGIHVPIRIDPEKGTLDFKIQLDLNGSGDLKFVPMGEITRVAITSPWTSPKFVGDFLPDNREVTDQGFKADWTVLNLNRSIPQVLKHENVHFNQYEFGVEFLMPANQYQKSTRTAKYAILVIGLTFLVFFFIQVLQKVNMHPFQYILVGLALVVFYVLLLSISEFLPFNQSYIMAGAATILLVTIYMHGIIRNVKFTGIIFLFMLLIYGFIFTIIQLEDTALLIGSIGLFVTLAAVMLVSRKVDWYNLKRAEK